MNSIQNNGPDDKLLTDELAELGHAYHQHEAEEPPELLDQAILNSAHRAVEKEDHWTDFGWVHGLTTAAVIVLALSIILTQREPVNLEENGLSPVDATSPGRSRSRSDEPQLSGKLQKQRAADMEYRQELRQETSKDLIQVMPAASTPESQSGLRTQATTARQTQGEVRAKKVLSSEPATLEEEMMEINAPAKADAAEQAVSTLADEPANMLKTDADKASETKAEAGRAQFSPEETILQAILALKHAGDDRWKDALKKFTENFPDYPLPDELRVTVH